jgi:diguanylate cyclase (GGDEF)-like protein
VRNQKNTGVGNGRVHAFGRYATLLGIPVCVAFGLALGHLLDVVIKNPLVATAVSLYLVFSIALLWLSDLRQQRMLRTVSQLESKLQKLRKKALHTDVQANYDGLTKLPNNRLLPDRFAQATERAKRNKTHVAIYLVKVDDFVPINTRYGADAGSLVISTTAKRLRSALRDTDTIVRISSSNFVVIAESLKALEHTRCLSEKLNMALGKSIEISNTTVVWPDNKLACVTYPSDGVDLDRLFSKARSQIESTSPHVVSMSERGKAPRTLVTQ